jgi:antitoxin protein of toxin-antitoxin system
MCRMSRGDIVGIGDKIGELKRKAQEVAGQHPDKVEQGIDKVEGYADERTGGKHSKEIDKGADQLKQHFGEQGPPHEQGPPQ